MPLDPSQFQQGSEADRRNEEIYGNGDAGWLKHHNDIEAASQPRRRGVTGPPGLMERLFPSDDFNREEDYQEL